MGKYSIKDLETLSGIKAHTIRIWEKRYGVVTPERTDTNIRTYCDDDLKKLLNIAMLNNNGLKISKISQLTQAQISEEIQRIAQEQYSNPTQIDRLVVAMVDLDRPKFEQIIKEGTEKVGFETFCIEVLYPFLQKVGIMWLANSINPAQEHFISSLIIQKMYVATDALYSASENKKKAVFFLREGEMHEMGMLFYRYLMVKRGYEAIYLGQSIPFEDLEFVVKAQKPDVLVTSFVATLEDGALEKFMEKLSKAFPDLPVIASGYQISEFEGQLPKNVIRANDIHEFIDAAQDLLEK
jgi:DNA-binding transcriptional MerR regulator